jgi:Ca2+-binding RTX toxin-like protein
MSYVGTVQGSADSDNYQFNLGDGELLINETSSNPGAEDVLRFGEGILPWELEIRREGLDLHFVHINGTDRVVVRNWFTSTGTSAASSTSSTLERIEFFDGWFWTQSDIAQLGVTSRGSEANDRLLGWSGNDHMFGEDGNDVLDAGAGSNGLYGGAGNDVLKVSSTATDNALEGGTGNDILIGSHNSDTYVFNLGDGVDVIKELGSNSGAVDTLLLGQGINPWDIELRKVGRNLEVVHTNGTDKVVVNNWFSTTGASATFSADSSLEQIVFDGPEPIVWSQSDLEQMGVLSQGGEGNDTLMGWSGNDRMLGEGGNDVLDAGSGRNSLFGGEGDDLLKVSTTATDNYFEGGAGNDTLIGSHNGDTYVFGMGSGVDVIKESGNNSGAEDVLLVNPSINPWDIDLHKVGRNLEIVYRYGPDKVVVNNWFTTTGSTATFSTDSTLERIIFPGMGEGFPQSEWTLENIAEMGVLSQGSEGDDTLRGWAGNDQMLGEGGNDVLDAGAGSNGLSGGAGDDLLKVSSTATDNHLEGGAGNDTLIGSHNGDTYVFGMGSGVDVIKELGSNSGAVDYLQFGAGIDEGDLWFERSANDLVIRSLDASDQVHIANWYSRSSAKVEVIQLMDGKQLLESQVQSLVDAMASFGVAPGGTINLSAGQQQQLDMVLAANWA